MLITHAAFVSYIVFNALTSRPFTHAKPVPSRSQLFASPNVNTSPIIVQRKIETSIPSRLNSVLPLDLLDQQPFPRANDDEHFDQIVRDAEKMALPSRTDFFSRYLEGQWESLQKTSKEPNSNEHYLIQFAAKQLHYLLKLTTARNLQSVIPIKMNEVTTKYLKHYIDFIIQKPSFPTGTSPMDTRIVIETIERHPEVAPQFSVTDNLRLRKASLEEHQRLSFHYDHDADLVIYVTWDLAYMRGLQRNVNDEITSYKEHCRDILSKTIFVPDSSEEDLIRTDISAQLEAENSTHVVKSKVHIMVENCIMRWTIFKDQIVEHPPMSKEKFTNAVRDDLDFFRLLTTYTDPGRMRLRDVGEAYTELYTELDQKTHPKPT
ncbi:hypothetical protein H0H93_001953 [Arthromyces matolae]|nr:hypothetical protein H0H93_001953 [Arthromyces matolae]